MQTGLRGSYLPRILSQTHIATRWTTVAMKVSSAAKPKTASRRTAFSFLRNSPPSIPQQKLVNDWLGMQLL